MTLEEKLAQTPAAAQWKEIGVRHHHGICLPISSLVTENSCGIGEYLDLLPMIDWCKQIGMDVIQILPINDMGLGTSPYNAISANALSPLYLSITHLPKVDQVPNYKEMIAKMQYWNRTIWVKYHVVRELKIAFLRSYFSIVFPEISITESYKAFCEQNPWLKSYALFKSLKETQLWKSWEDWPSPYKSPSEQGYQDLLETYKQACDFHIFVQYLCFQQFEEVKRFASAKGLFIKGDIPILISRDSADVWHNRHTFLLYLSAGAPPDMYSRNGQEWGFPLYDWKELEKNNYNWWRERLRGASHLYHLYRIDHVVGFFRMWSVPLGKSPQEGSFVPSNESEWIPQGRKLMEMMLSGAPILPIGEDLGLVPPEVRQCLYDLGICGTKVMRWERHWNTDGSYIPVTEYPPTTMTTVSTHDSDTLQLWWGHSPKEAKLFCEFKGWDYKPFLSAERQKEILRDAHHSSSLFHINLLQEYLALFPELIFENRNHERINIPGKVLDTNWTYRFRPTVETIVQHAPLRQAMLDILR